MNLGIYDTEESFKARVQKKRKAESSWEQYKKDPNVIYKWDVDDVKSRLFAINLTNYQGVDVHYQQLKQFADILKERAMFLERIKIRKQLEQMFAKKQTKEEQEQLSFFEKVKRFFTGPPSRESKLTSLEKMETFDQERIQTYSRRNEIGEEVTYITNPKPNYGFKTGTNIPRELYKEEVERIKRSYKNYNDKKDVSSNAPSTNQVDMKKKII